MQSSAVSKARLHTPSLAKSSRSSDASSTTLTAPTALCQVETCPQLHLFNFDFCSRHILQDQSAPFRQCAYVYHSTGKRCLSTAPKVAQKEGYCAEHSRKALSMKLRTSRQRAPAETADTLLQSLSHYVPTQAAGKLINPIEDIDASRLNGGVARVLDLASDSDSDNCEGGAVTLDAAWSGDSETEGDSPDSDMEDPLRHAGVYTDEEVVAQARDRLKRLQTLYLREFRSLQFRLREQRRFYLLSLKREKETMMSIHQQLKRTPDEIAMYRKLQALNHYRRPHGAEAVLHKKAKDRKAQALLVTPTNRQPHASRCSFAEGGVKCDDKALPLTKLCHRHILNDTQQLLFRACAVSRAELPPCREPVLAVFADASCLCHKYFPQEPKEDMEIDVLVLESDSKSPSEKTPESIPILDLEEKDGPDSFITSIQTTEVTSEQAILDPLIDSNEVTLTPLPEPTPTDRRRKQDLSETLHSSQETDNLSLNNSLETAAEALIL